MKRLFGIPMGGLAAGVAVALGVALAVIGALAVRNRVLARLGLRNVTRRRARTSLIVVGLMLGTAIISSALTTGDTMSRTIRSAITASLGNVDEIVRPLGSTSSIALPGGVVSSLDPSAFDTVRMAVAGSPLVDGIAPAIVDVIAVADITSRQQEPRIGLFGADPATLGGFGTIRGRAGQAVSLADLADGEVFLDRAAADALDANTGDEVQLLAGQRVESRRVRDIVYYDGALAGDGAVLLPLEEAQALVGRPGRIDAVLVSNRGGRESGASLTDEVVALLDPALRPLGLEATDAKRDGLDVADQVGSVFMSVFSTFGTFSIAAGILLIFLIFVMLAAERRSEMGIARAVGTRRGHLVEMFLFEGALYDLAAAVVGAVLGIGVAFAMVALMARAFGQSFGMTMRYGVSWRSVVVAYGLGVLFTLVVVTLSAWRVSVLNIVTAIRNLPDPLVRRGRRAAWWRGGLGIALGVLLMVGAGGQATPLMVGVSLVIISLVPPARALGLPDRIAYTAAGVALVAFWLLPFSLLSRVFGDLSMDFSIWIMAGLLIVLGATWTIMYNADVVLTGVSAVAGRLPSWAPVVRAAVAYPLRSRFRTGVTMAMFTLVVFTLVVGAVTVNAFTAVFNDADAFGGGYQVTASVAPHATLTDPVAELTAAPGVSPGMVTGVSAVSQLALEARQDDGPESRDFATVAVRGLDDAFLTSTTFQLAAIADGYGSAQDVWRALAADPTLAVVDAYSVPRRAKFSFGAASPLHLEGFLLEDGHFAPIPLDLRDPQTGAVQSLRVVGVLRDTAVTMAGVSVSQRTLAPLGERAQPTSYLMRLAPGTDAESVARSVEAAFLANGMQADAVSELLSRNVAANRTMNNLVLGFMGLGLVVGVVALGVVSARSVVERRQQIGVLRAIGFQQAMVLRTFLLEAAFVSLTSIVAGVVLGLAVAYNVVADQRSQPSWQGLQFTVPLFTLGLVFVIVLLAALGASALPARRAARIYPAEALRYQ